MRQDEEAGRTESVTEIQAYVCRPDEADPEFCAAHVDGMFTTESRVCDSAPEPED